MQLYHSLSDFKKLPKAIVTTGTYDGIHLGHKKILTQLVKKAKELGGESVVITFWPHPRKIVSVNNEQEVKILSSHDEKIDLLEEIGIDHLLIIPFTREFSELSPEEYVQEILVEHIGTHYLVLGYDHRFGKDRSGDFALLKNLAQKYQFTLEEISRQDIENLTVSSTEIRNSLLSGEVSKVIRLLGRPYGIRGLVVKGKQLGRTIDFATANIKPDLDEKLIPADGVYAVYVYHNKRKFSGMMNIGKRPTVDGLNRTIEVHILDFNKEIYGEQLEVSFIDKIRDEQKFKSLDDLKIQLNKDKEMVQKILKG